MRSSVSSGVQLSVTVTCLRFFVGRRIMGCRILCSEECTIVHLTRQSERAMHSNNTSPVLPCYLACWLVNSQALGMRVWG